jgi:hypothetical protein
LLRLLLLARHPLPLSLLPLLRGALPLGLLLSMGGLLPLRLLPLMRGTDLLGLSLLLGRAALFRLALLLRPLMLRPLMLRTLFLRACSGLGLTLLPCLRLDLGLAMLLGLPHMLRLLRGLALRLLLVGGLLASARGLSGVLLALAERVRLLVLLLKASLLALRLRLPMQLDARQLLFVLRLDALRRLPWPAVGPGAHIVMPLLPLVGPDLRHLLQLRLALLGAVEARRRRLEAGFLPPGKALLGLATDKRLAAPVTVQRGFVLRVPCPPCRALHAGLTPLAPVARDLVAVAVPQRRRDAESGLPVPGFVKLPRARIIVLRRLPLPLGAAGI